MRLLIGGWPTGQNKIKSVIFMKVVNNLRPSRRVPQFFPASRARMQNDVRSRDAPITPKPVSFFERRLRKVELRSGRNSTDTERLEQCQIVIDCVHIPHTHS